MTILEMFVTSRSNKIRRNVALSLFPLAHSEPELNLHACHSGANHVIT
ncbi:hypothetical protein CEXT_222111, partial [Caerostris extrusa]